MQCWPNTGECLERIEGESTAVAVDVDTQQEVLQNPNKNLQEPTVTLGGDINTAAGISSEAESNLVEVLLFASEPVA